ncbi:MAG: SprB repeat-containing protein, partial [Cytophagales bacterium]|nr:SprB repeat-containing protein [Cytophagales bacterium]
MKIKVLFGLFFFLPFHLIFSQHVMMTNFELKITNGTDCPLRDESKPAIGERKLRTSSDGNWRMSAEINSTALFNYDIKCSESRTYKNSFFRSYSIPNEYLPFKVYRHFNTPMVKATCSFLLGCCCESYSSDNWDDWADDYKEDNTENFNFIYRNGTSYLPNRIHTATHTIGNNTLKFDYSWELPQFGSISISGFGTRCPGQEVTFTVDNSPLNKTWLSYFTLKYYWIVTSTSTSYNYQTVTNSNVLTFSVPNTSTTQNLKVECIPVINDNYCYPTVNFLGSNYPQYKIPSSIFTISASPPSVSVTPISPTCNPNPSTNVSTNGGLRFVVNGSVNDYSLSIRKKRADGSWYNMNFNSNSTALGIRNDFSGFLISNSNMSSSSKFEAGEYQYQVKNYFSDFGNQCMTTGTSTIVGVTPIQVTNVTNTPPTCFNGSNATISIQASGPSGRTFRYFAPNFIGKSGTYDVYAVDDYGCQSINSIPTIIPQPSSITSTFSVSNYNGFGISCSGANNGTIMVTPNGAPIPDNVGLSQYTSTIEKYVYNPLILGYNWERVNISSPNCGYLKYYYYNSYYSNGYTYKFNDCNKYSLSPGTYRVSVSDFNGCATVTSTNLVITEPPIFSTSGVRFSNYNGYNSSCGNSNDAFITLTVSGGSGKKTIYVRHYVNQPYWGDCADDCGDLPIEQCCSLIDNYVIDQLVFSTTTGNVLSLTNLEPKTYEIQVVDANGCTAYLSTVTLTSPPAIYASVKVTHPSCFNLNDGIVTLTASGGSGGFKYSLSTETVNGISPTSTSTSFLNNSSGVYKARIRDSNGCEFNNPSGLLLTITQPGLLTVSGASFTIPCKDGALSSIAGIVRGGTPPYQYNWIQGFSTTNTGQFFVPNAKAGTYLANVTDKNNCTNGAVSQLQMTLTASEPASKLNFVSSA